MADTWGALPPEVREAVEAMSDARIVAYECLQGDVAREAADRAADALAALLLPLLRGRERPQAEVDDLRPRSLGGV